MLIPQSLRVKRTRTPSKGMIQKLINHIVNWVIFFWYQSPVPSIPATQSAWMWNGSQTKEWSCWSKSPTMISILLLEKCLAFLVMPLLRHWIGNARKFNQSDTHESFYWCGKGKRASLFGVLASLLHEETWSGSKSINVKKTLSNGAQAALVSNST